MQPPSPGKHPLDSLRPAHGHVEDTDFDRARLSGWIFLPDVHLQTAEIQVDGVTVGTAELEYRPKVAGTLAQFHPFNQRTNFTLRVPAGRLRADRLNHITVVGCRDGRPVTRMKSIVFPPSLIPEIPIPPPRLIELTQGDHNTIAYRMLGYRFYQQFREIIARQRDLSGVKRIFDWGCGSGRVAAYFLSERAGPEVFGGDMNHDAVAWCQEYLKPGNFRALHPLPPLPYADGTFDVILAIGVVGGCGAAEYAVWLPDLRRVLAPNGLMIMSIQGKFAAEVLYPKEALDILKRDGLFDGSAYDTEHPPASEDRRYRGGTYLSRDYVQQVWSPSFEILENFEGELNSDLDLLLLRRRD